MQGLHHQQQQLAGLLSVALSKDDSTSNITVSSSYSSDNDESSRLSAINSLHRAILYPPNSLLVAHSATFLSQGLSTLLSDKSFLVRQAAATTYGALCSVLCSVPIASSGRQNHVILGSLVDRFISWALPLVTNVSDGEGIKELALEALREFLNVGDVGALERYALPVLKACQELVEDERTSLKLLHQVLGVLTLISLRFSRCFQPHFVDIVDLLLGWALVPDLADLDRRVIMDSFLQFQKHWVNHVHFSLGLLSKFLGDMDVLLQDGSSGTAQQFRRLLALLTCFSTVLQSTASGMLEANLMEQITDPLSIMIPQLLECFSMIGRKFGWLKWVGDLWRGLTLLAEIFSERFSMFYPHAVTILFKSLEFDDVTQSLEAEKITPLQAHGVLKTNLQLLSLQKHGLLPSSVLKILQFDSPISQLRLHPNHLVTGSSAATYIFLLQHENNEVVEQAVASLTEELFLLKDMLVKFLGSGYDANGTSYSKQELFSLIKFDLKVLQSCIYVNAGSSLVLKLDIDAMYASRSNKLISFIVEKLNPFDLPIQGCVELQVNIMMTLDRLAAFEFSTSCSARKQTSEIGYVDVVINHIKKYSALIVKALDISSPLSVKQEAFEWIRRFCESVLTIYDNSSTDINICESYGYAAIIRDLVFSVLDTASNREPKVRSHAASVLELLLQARLIPPMYFYPICEVVLERLGDTDDSIKSVYVRLLSNVLPVTVYVCGLSDCESVAVYRPGFLKSENRSYLHWKQVFALKQLRRQLSSQQLVSVLSYISQRWKVSLSTWVQRLIYNGRNSKESVSAHLDETAEFGTNGLKLEINVDEDILEKIWFVNNLASAFWAIQEAARYCISTRLRTNLGGPTQTFAALERMLLDIAHLSQLDTKENDGNMNVLGTACAHLLPMRLLLDFVESLKKNVYNAYDGSIVLPSATPQSSLFFRANKKVCVEWFSRICEPMMNVGLALHCHEATIHYCSLRLQELRNLVSSAMKEKSRVQVAETLRSARSRYAGDILRVLRHIALSLCRDRQPESLVGLEKWVSLTFSFLLTEENQSLRQNTSAGPFSWITGLVYQAGGQYEKAVAHFTHLLQNEESLSYMGSEGVQFAIARIIESYTAVSDWKALESWLLELQILRAKHAGKSYFGALTTAGNEINTIHALARFDEGDTQAAWACLDLTPKSSSDLTIDCKLALQRSEQMLLQAMLYKVEGKVDEVSHEIQKSKAMLEEALSVLPLDGLLEAAPLATQFHCIFAFDENHSNLKSSKEKLKPLQSVVSSYVRTMHFPIFSAYQDCSPWLKVHRVYRTIDPTSAITLKLSLNLLRLARKQGNLGLANRLCNFLRDNINSCAELKDHNSLKSGLQYEGTMLMHAENKLGDSIENLWSFVRPSIIASENTGIESEDSFLKAKAFLKLAEWLRQDISDAAVEKMAFKIQYDFNVGDVSSIGLAVPLSDKSVFEPSKNLIVEEIFGTFTKFSSRLFPTMGKSWISYASWCYNQARDSLSTPLETVIQSCSFSPFLASEVLPNRFQFTEEEKTKVETIIMQLFCDNNASVSNDEEEGWNLGPESAVHIKNVNHVKTLLEQTVNIMEVAAGSPGAENLNGECLSAQLASRLLMSFLNSNAGLTETEISSTISELVEVWGSLRRRRVFLFGSAAHSFIQYLSYSSARICNGRLAVTVSGSLKQKSESYTLRATLYVLQILLNFGVELKDTLEPALSTVPLLPWQEITPQLFSRLSSHPEQVVRNQLEGLLMSLAKQSPWSIVYPTLVDVNAYEEGPSEELQHLLSCLTKHYPRLIQDVQLMINELGNVTVLWEELWLSTLQELHTDVTRRIILLKEEAARIAENITLSHSEKDKINAAKYSAMMAPIVVALERRFASTSRKPETPHETWFNEAYEKQLKSAILTFKSPPASAAVLGDVWRPFDNIATSLAAYQRKSSISLGEVAPQLALLSSSYVPMPGHEKQITVAESENGNNSILQGIVTISSFSEQVVILSTKTKPKKLVMLGSDGQKYTYLLKGREDLRLDARIMQLLQAINGFLYSSSASNTNSLGIRYYSVTPISGRAGLIQWVGNVVSIYSVFKSWQNRDQLAQLSAMGASNSKDSFPPPIPRPSDMFYGKIIPALKEKGIRRVISRRDWPHDVKRKVLLDLMNETPRELLHQELWCASEGFRAFSSKLKRYSGSVAAMSMVGHILGLGDRHLDNILIDLYSGDIVHIDYNVCFDKGQRLKIPEIVPFRLTQIIEATLGLTGVEGTFRANCEAVIGLLKKNKDILLMLLEVFVWDPLVEWTRGDFHDDAAIGGEERKGMELAVSLSLFASRVQEIRVPLQEHHDLLLATLPAVESTFERFADILNQYEHVSAFFYRADEERSNLILSETSAKLATAEANSVLEKARASYEIHAREFAQAKNVISESAQELTTWLDQHGRILDALRSSLIPEINASINLSSMEETLSLTSAVMVAGVPLTIVPEPTQAQCQDIDKEVSNLIKDLDHGLSSAVTELQAYSLALQRILPLNYITSSPVHGWVQVLLLSANTLSSDILAMAGKQAAELIEKVYTDNPDSARQIHGGLCLNVEKYSLEIKKVEDECAELERSIGSEAELKAKSRFLSAFKKYMRSAGLPRKEDFTSLQSGPYKHGGELEDKKEKVLLIVNMAISSLYSDIKHRVLEIFVGSSSNSERNINNRLEFDFGTVLSEFEEQVEKCALVAGLVNELRDVVTPDTLGINKEVDHSNQFSETDWISIVKASVLSSKSLIWKMTEVYLSDVIRFAISLNSTIMDAFGSISQVRGSIDMALEQLIEVEIERASLDELEKSYFVKVGLITEQQLAIEEAAMHGRDNLSWEEAEELASQEEACRAQLHQLHQKWNQKGMQSSFLNKREAGIRNTFISSLRHFQSVTTIDEEKEVHVPGSKALLSELAKPFAELELVDRALSSSVAPAAPAAAYSNDIPKLADLMSSGSSLSEDIWKVDGLLSGHSFFIWEVGVLDSFLDSCIHDVASYIDQNLGFDQLFNVVKKKLENQLQQHIIGYLKERVAPALLACIDKEIEHLMQPRDDTNELVVDQVKKEGVAVRRVQLMLEEYCISHETARSAKAAVSVMKRKVNELKEDQYKTSLEVVQMEWMHDATLKISNNNRATFQKFLASSDNLYPIILNLGRSKLLENLQSAVTKIARSVEHLQACERISVTAEGQLERAMGWACGGPNLSAGGSTANRSSGIPPEFHDHLMRRRQMLWKVREKASDIINVCMSMLEFEVSRDGLFQIPEKNYTVRSSDDARTWQQTYMNAVSKLDVSFHSCTSAEQEWKVAESRMEVASKELISATNKLGVASLKAKSASGDLQSTVLSMRDCAYDAGVSLTAFSRMIRGHTSLTSECGSMLEEVLAITVNLHDVHNLGKEAASLHHALMEDLSKAKTILLPLELMFSKDVAAMTDAMAKERETQAELSPIHGQAIYQSYCLRIREACKSFNPLVPSLTFSVTGLHSLLIRLARTASLHAGNLHKAFEGLGESQEVRSQEINLSKPSFTGEAPEYNRKERDSFARSDNENTENLIERTELSLQDNGWFSPPNSLYSSSSESDITSDEASPLCGFDDPSEVLGKLSVIPNEATHCLNTVSFDETNSQERNFVNLTINKLNENDEFGDRDEESSPDQLKIEDKSKQTRCTNVGSRTTRGKNPYAMSVLRRIEMKIEGQDIADNREVGIAEQVDYLLRQATSVDNLCNMYEGWTPWI